MTCLTITAPLHATFVKPNLESMNIKRFYEYPGPKTWLLSFPTSGNTWTRYSIEATSGIPTLSNIFAPGEKFLPINCPLGFSFPSLRTDVTKRPIWKVHRPGEMLTVCQYDTQHDTLILLLRNYKEEVGRYNNPISHKVFQPYFANLALFDTWNPDKKIMILYEDLITNPKETLTRLLEFLGESTEFVDEFIENIEQHRKECLQIYQIQGNNPYSRGSDILFHSKKLTPQRRKLVDKEVSASYPNLWKKYLKDLYSEEVIESKGLYS